MEKKTDTEKTTPATPAVKETRPAITPRSPEHEYMWAKQEVKSLTDKNSKPYSWVPANALKATSTADYAKEIITRRAK